MGTLAGIAKGLEILKTVNEFSNEIDDKIKSADFKMQVADLRHLLADSKIALSEAKEAIAERDAIIEELKKVQASKMKTIAYRGFNYGVEGNQSIGLPFCPHCEKEGMQMQVSEAHLGGHFCSVCNTKYSSCPGELPVGFYSTSE